MNSGDDFKLVQRPDTYNDYTSTKTTTAIKNHHRLSQIVSHRTAERGVLISSGSSRSRSKEGCRKVSASHRMVVAYVSVIV